MDRVIDITSRRICRDASGAEHMGDGGRIIMIGSSVGERVLVPGLCPTRHEGGVKIFTQALSREVGSRGITVNNVQPGPIETDLNPARVLAYHRRPRPHSSVMGTLRISPRWWRSSPVRKRLTSPGRT